MGASSIGGDGYPQFNSLQGAFTWNPERMPVLTIPSHGGKPEFCSLACVSKNIRFCATWGPGLLGKSIHLSGTRLPRLQKGKGENRLALMVSKTSVLKSLLSRMFLEMGLHICSQTLNNPVCQEYCYYYGYNSCFAKEETKSP